MSKAKSKAGDATALPAGAPPAVPAVEQWTSPMAWVGESLKPHAEWVGNFPANAVYVRGEIALMLQTPTGPGMSSTSFPHIPAVIRLEGGKPVEVHAAGIDGRCWTYRAEKDGRKTRWRLFLGDAFPATEPASTAWTQPYFIEYAVVQSLLPAQTTGKHISILISEDGSAENLAKAKDPDRND